MKRGQEPSCHVTPATVMVVPVPSPRGVSEQKLVWKAEHEPMLPPLASAVRTGGGRWWDLSHGLGSCSAAGFMAKLAGFGDPHPPNGSTSAPENSSVSSSVSWRRTHGRALTVPQHAPHFLHKCFFKEYITTLALFSKVFCSDSTPLCCRVGIVAIIWL